MRPVLLLQQPHCRAELLGGGFTDGEQTRRGFPALVKRRVDIGNPLAHHLAQPLTDGADVHANDGVDGAGFDQIVDDLFHRFGGLNSGVDHDELHLAPHDSALFVKLGHGDLRAGDAGWCPYPRRSTQRDHQGHTETFGRAVPPARMKVRQLHRQPIDVCRHCHGKVGPPALQNRSDATLQLKLLSKSTNFTWQAAGDQMSKQQTPFDGYISYALAAAHRSVTQSLTARLKKHGVQIEAWRIMESLDGDARLTMGALARLVLINPPTLSKLVDRMVSDGLVHRQAAQGDQRQVNLLLTDLGRLRMLQIRRDVEEQDAFLAQQLDEDDGDQLITLLSKLVK